MNKYQHWLKPTAWLRLLGLLLLGVLLWRLDISALTEIIKSSVWQSILLAVMLNVPMVFIKTVRWWYLVRSQNIHYPISKSFLAYFSSIFIGFLTPGRLGELTKAMYISVDSSASMGRAFSSVLADRLFDLCALVGVGSAALISVTRLNIWQSWAGMVLLIGGLTLALVLLITDQGFALMRNCGSPLGQIGRRLFASGSWLFEMRAGLRQLSWLTILISVVLTVIAYAIFFGQCYLLALALRLPVTFASVSYAVALGSLVTLLPISISGIGTRDAAIVAYLGTVGVPSEMALAFSLLVFLTFYIGGGLMGFVAWCIRPAPLDRLDPFASQRKL